jgi:hypothetical protein
LAGATGSSADAARFIIAEEVAMEIESNLIYVKCGCACYVARAFGVAVLWILFAVNFGCCVFWWKEQKL